MVHLKSLEKYRGNFIAGKFHGRGRLQYADGADYEGMFAAGLKEGLASLRGAAATNTRVSMRKMCDQDLES